MKRICTVLLTIIIAILSANAKTSEQIVPVDTALRQGILPNGMTYYVRKAVNKKHIGEFRLIQRTGSLVEEETVYGPRHTQLYMHNNKTIKVFHPYEACHSELCEESQYAGSFLLRTEIPPTSG